MRRRTPNGRSPGTNFLCCADDAGRYADFHSLRHSFVSLITQGGVHPKLAQRLARHSTVGLTLARYSHWLMADEAQALEVLPALPSMFDRPGTDRQQLRQTGTDGGGSVLQTGLQAQLPIRHISVHQDAASEVSISIPFDDGAKAKTAGKTRGKPGLPADSDKRRGRDSNPRYPCGYTGFRDRPIRPLWHLSCSREPVRIATRRGNAAGLPASGILRRD